VIHGGEKRAVIERVVLSPGNLILPRPLFSVKSMSRKNSIHRNIDAPKMSQRVCALLPR
jgi:hypothetical protein